MICNLVTVTCKSLTIIRHSMADTNKSFTETIVFRQTLYFLWKKHDHFVSVHDYDIYASVTFERISVIRIIVTVFHG